MPFMPRESKWRKQRISPVLRCQLGHAVWMVWSWGCKGQRKQKREKKRQRKESKKGEKERQIKTEKRERGGPSYSFFSLPGAHLWSKLDFSDICSCKHRQPFFRKWIGRNGGTTLSSNLQLEQDAGSEHLCPSSQDPLLWPPFLQQNSECLRLIMHRSGPLHSCTSSISSTHLVPHFVWLHSNARFQPFSLGSGKTLFRILPHLLPPGPTLFNNLAYGYLS